jgi:hypothetical protein
MMSDFMRDVANVFDKIAEHLDQEETARQDLAQAERHRTVETLSEKYASVTGEQLSATDKDRIANSDQDLIKIFEKLAERTYTSEELEDMGAGENLAEQETAQPETRREFEKQASAEADERMLNWIME